MCTVCSKTKLWNAVNKHLVYSIDHYHESFVRLVIFVGRIINGVKLSCQCQTGIPKKNAYSKTVGRFFLSKFDFGFNIHFKRSSCYYSHTVRYIVRIDVLVIPNI